MRPRTFRDRGHRADIAVAQPMTGMAFEPKPRAERRRLLQPSQLRPFGLAVQFAVAAGMQFDDRCTQHHGGLELARIGLDEQRYADASVA